ncbi:hypothetical protein R3P38DRAFT_3215772 [Favolaschia claudopus]|uniref:Uncharacterized protein n=1 Tax=Favolaschia claudopus TaxID=2862362 RepID=A0AAW0A8A8_9AGAR
MHDQLPTVKRLQVRSLKTVSTLIDLLGPPPAATITILGTTTKVDKPKGTFEMEAEQYSLAHAEAKSAAEKAAQASGQPVVAPPKSMLRVAGFFNAESPRYKNAKNPSQKPNFPVPWAPRLALVVGFLAGVSEELEGSAMVRRLRLEVDDVTFGFGGPAAPTSSVVPATPAASGSGQSRFSTYSNSNAQKRARVDEAPPTSSPTPSSTTH